MGPILCRRSKECVNVLARGDTYSVHEILPMPVRRIWHATSAGQETYQVTRTRNTVLHVNRHPSPRTDSMLAP